LSLSAFRARLMEGLDFVVGRWAAWIAAGVIGGACAALAYAALRLTPASYPDLVVGFLAVNGGELVEKKGTFELIPAGKVGDYAMLLAFMLGAAALMIALGDMLRRLARIAGADAVESAYTRLIVAVIPFAFWCATFVFQRDQSVALFWIAAALTTAVTLGVAVALIRARLQAQDRVGDVTGMIDAMTLVPIAAVLAVFALAMMAHRVGILIGPPLFIDLGVFKTALIGAGLAGVVGVAAAILAVKDDERLGRGLRSLILLLQVPLPALFLAVLPAPIAQSEGTWMYAQPVTVQAWAALAALSLALWADLARLRRQGANGAAGPAGAVSMLSLIAVIVYCRAPIAPALGAPMDDYHAGEDFIPWWSWIEHGLTPLWDFTPPRGLINYKHGLLAGLFTEQTAAGMLAIGPYHFAMIALLAFPPIALAIGKWRAFLVFLLAAMDDRIGDIDTLMTAGLCLLVFAWTRLSHVGWLLAWFAVGTLAVLIAPGQGGLLVLVTAPGGTWRLYRAVRDQRQTLLRAAGITLVVVAVLAAVTPLGLMVVGAVRYGVGQSAVNAIANGIPWSLSFGSVSQLHPWLFEILRFSWLGAGVIAIVLTLRIWADAGHADRSVALFVGAAVSLFCMFYVVRGGVRIDSGYVGRPGWASIWALTLLIPVLLTLTLRGPRQLTALTAVLTVAAMFANQFGRLDVDAALRRPYALQAPVSDHIGVDGSRLGMPNLGRLNLDDASVKRLTTVKSQLDAWLAPDETFLDMTNRGAQYFYFNRPPPSDLSAPYNMITADQQRRTVDSVIRKNVAVALIGPDNINFDGVIASLRAYLVYRYLTLNFVPATVDGYDYMLTPDRLAKVGLAGLESSRPDEQALQILDRNFLLGNLQMLPVAFGRSAAALDDLMEPVVALDATAVKSVSGLEQGVDGRFRMTGGTTSVTYTIPIARLRGRDAGLLAFDFACLSRRVKPRFTLRWSSADAPTSSANVIAFSGREGRMIVPVDSAPRWLLAPGIEQVTLELIEADGCAEFTLANVALAQRRAATALDEVVATGARQ
jgi:hypothetical protein